ISKASKIPGSRDGCSPGRQTHTSGLSLCLSETFTRPGSGNLGYSPTGRRPRHLPRAADPHRLTRPPKPPPAYDPAREIAANSIRDDATSVERNGPAFADLAGNSTGSGPRWRDGRPAGPGRSEWQRFETYQCWHTL